MRRDAFSTLDLLVYIKIIYYNLKIKKMNHSLGWEVNRWEVTAQIIEEIKASRKKALPRVSAKISSPWQWRSYQ
jgi:hypothetical protein